MSALDPYTAASPIYREAIRHPHKTGSAFEVAPRRFPLKDFIALLVLIACGWLALAIGALAAAGV